MKTEKVHFPEKLIFMYQSKRRHIRKGVIKISGVPACFLSGLILNRICTDFIPHKLTDKITYYFARHPIVVIIGDKLL